MCNSFKHLNERAQAVVILDDSKRIEYICTPRWIPYTKAEQVLARLEGMYSYPKRHRMPNLLLVSDTNNGKTMLINEFLRRHPADDNPDGDAISFPVTVVTAPPAPDEGRLYDYILSLISAPFREKEKASAKERQTIGMLERIGTKLLVIDEFHQAADGPSQKQQAFLNAVKGLGNKLRISIVAAGTDKAFNLLQSDPQLANRFEPAALPKWEMDYVETAPYLRLLASFERRTPLREPSNLTENNLAQKIHSMSEGFIGEIANILERASIKAINEMIEHINIDMLNSIDWIQPSDRKWRAN
jgi:hypothetical protein